MCLALPDRGGGATWGNTLEITTVVGGAPAVGAAIILATVSFAGPAQATYACWNSEDGRHCREFGDGASAQGTVRPVDYPTFSGILAAGQILTSYSGDWARAQTLTYQWLRDGVVIPGAAGETYRITAADTKHTLALRVTGSAPGLEDGVATTLPSPPVSDDNAAEFTARPSVTITGEAPVVDGFSRVGFTLDVINLGTWSPDVVTLQWQADGVDIEGANGDSYRIRVSDLGKRITLNVTGSWPGAESVSKSNTAPVVTRGYIHAGDEMHLVGGSKTGNVLSVAPYGWYADGEPMSFLYQWKRDGRPIEGATAATYTIAAADNGHQIHVEVTATAPGYGPNTRSSLFVEVDGDAVRTPAADIPTATASPTMAPTPTASPTATATGSPSQSVSASPSPSSTRIFLPVPRGGGEAEPQAGATVLPGILSGPASGTVRAQPGGEPPAESPLSEAAPAMPAAAVAASATAGPVTHPPSGGSATPSEPVTVSAPQESTAGSFSLLPLLLAVGGAVLAGALVWFGRPVRAAHLHRRANRAAR